MRYEYSSGKTLERIMGFSHSGAPVRDLSRIKALMSAVGDPQKGLRFIHIAGTNGKGSTAEMFSSVLRETGERTGLFTSPFILEYADRIRVDGENIPADTLAKTAERVLRAAEKLPCRGELSQFEITQAIALLHFAAEGCGTVVLETGLGGLLDCTNALENKRLAVITSVDFDHRAILGDTLTAIARQKAGIMRRGVPCVAQGHNSEEVRAELERAAGEIGADLSFTDPEQLRVISDGLEGVQFSYRGQEYAVPMGGAHQARNAAAVIDGCGILGIEPGAVRRGLSKARVPARAELICREPAIILDGAHNPDAMRALAAHLREKLPEGSIGVVGMCRDKEMRAALGEIVPYFRELITVDGFSERAENAGELKKLIEELGGRAEVFEGTAEELMAGLRERKEPAVIFGSLYLAAWIRNRGE